MSKELEAYDIVFNSFNNCTCQDGRFSVRSALDTIYQALKRNEPMKRILHQSVNEKYPELLCPSCFVSNDPLNHYCPKCGQKLDWGSEK